jgi:hypothetical protein
LTGGSNLKNGRETGGKTKIPPVPQPLCTKAFRAKKGGREGHFDVRHKKNTPRVTKMKCTPKVGQKTFGVYYVKEETQEAQPIRLSSLYAYDRRWL